MTTPNHPKTNSRSPSSALLLFFGWEGSPTRTDYRKKGYPYSSLSTGGPRIQTTKREPTRGRGRWIDLELKIISDAGPSRPSEGSPVEKSTWTKTPPFELVAPCHPVPLLLAFNCLVVVSIQPTKKVKLLAGDLRAAQLSQTHL